MAEPGTVYHLYVGVDIAADTFTAAWLVAGGTPTAPITGEQTPAGYAGLQRRLKASGVAPAETLVVVEATGNYWVALAVTLHEAGYRVSVVNPLRAHHFAKAQLRRAKTDALDARDLAQLALALCPASWTPPPAVYHEVRQRLVARDALLDMRQQARNQRHALLRWPVVVEGVRRHLDELIADLDRRIAGLDAEIAAALKGSAWAESLACLTSAPGIGLVTAAWLLVGTLNFTLCPDPAALAAYAGLVPIPPYGVFIRRGATNSQLDVRTPRVRSSDPARIVGLWWRANIDCRGIVGGFGRARQGVFGYAAWPGVGARGGRPPGRRRPMTLHPHAGYTVPEDTARAARAAFPEGARCLRLHDELGRLSADQDCAARFPTRGQPALAPARRVLVTLLPFAAGLADRQAADAVRGRIEGQDALGPEREDPA
jgi:transposase